MKKSQLLQFSFGVLAFLLFTSSGFAQRKINGIVQDAKTNAPLEGATVAVKGIKPGMTGIEADAIARDHITSKGYGEAFGHSTGHGIGMEVHEAPRLSSQSEVVLEPNMVVTVEPGIYLPGIGGVRIEDDIVITEDGNERLTFATKELLIL